MQLYTPKPGEEVAMKSETKLIKAKLHMDMLQDLELRSVAEYEVARFDAEMKMVDQELQLVPQDSVGGHISVVDGMAVGVEDTLLYDFRKTLQQEGLRSEMRGKILLCEDGVYIQKNAPHDFVIEGPLCSTYYKVREMFFKLYTFLV